MINHERNAGLLVSSYFARACSTYCRDQVTVFGVPGAAGRILYSRCFTQEKKKPRRAGLK
jgi:hypothetical protein